MYNHKCFFCNKIFISKNKISKYCSRICCDKNKIGKKGYWSNKKRPDMTGKLHPRYGIRHSKEARDKISEGINNFYKTKEGNEYRKIKSKEVTEWFKNNKHYFIGKKLSKDRLEKLQKGNREWIKNNKPWNYKGGKYRHSGGYIEILVKDHPKGDIFGYILEHRYIVEKFINRYLNSNEVIHHINKIRHDNRPNNLMAFNSHSAHLRFHKDPNNVRPEEIIFDGRKLNLTP